MTTHSALNPSSNLCCPNASGPGYASPEAAINGPRETVLFVTCANVDPARADMLATVCVDPRSAHYSKAGQAGAAIYFPPIFCSIFSQFFKNIFPQLFSFFPYFSPFPPSRSQIIGTVEMPYAGDEVHHTGWNACSSCHGQAGKARTHLVLPCLNSSRIYAIDVAEPTQPRVDKASRGGGGIEKKERGRTKNERGWVVAMVIDFIILKFY